MAEKKIQRVMRTRRLTPQEAAIDKEIRRRVAKEFPHCARPRCPQPNSFSASVAEGDSSRASHIGLPGGRVSQIGLIRET